MTCYDTMLLDRYQAEVDAAEAQEAAEEAMIERAGRILAREAAGLKPTEWHSKLLSGGWTMDEVLSDSIGNVSDIDSTLAELYTCDHPLAVKLRDLLLQHYAQKQFLVIVPTYDAF